jgi:hypothetical protein
MRYRVRARVKPGQAKALKRAIDADTLGQGSVAGDEYLRNMAEARLHGDGTAEWIEVCFCRVPLAEERDYWEEYFDLITVEDAVDRRTCKHESGKQPWSCVDCTCTRKLEQDLRQRGLPFYENL